MSTLITVENPDGQPVAGQADSSGNIKVNIAAGTVTATTDTGSSADYDTGGGTDTVQMMGLALPASGGAVAGGTATNPVRTDPVGTTTQPVSVASIAAGDNNIGNVDIVTITVPSALFHGQTTVATAGTEVTLGASQTLTQGVWIKALHANTGMIYVGANPVTSSTGFVLDAGETIFLPIANRTTVFVDSSVNGEGVSYIAV